MVNKNVIDTARVTTNSAALTVPMVVRALPPPASKVEVASGPQPPPPLASTMTAQSGKGGETIENEEISTISRSLKSVAKELNVPVNCLSQLSRFRRKQTRFIPLMKTHKLEFHWIKGHAGHPENERCDQLAVKAAQSQQLSVDVVFEQLQNSAIDNEMKISGDDYVGLDCRHMDQEKFREHFPNIYKKCLEEGIDPFKQLIPVVPACHYLMGGIDVDINGQSSIKNLFAVGECTKSGLHGAKSTSANSLLEGLVFVTKAAVKKQ
ncbi:hypothetical protein FQR65_LT16225 [Abscondita terminalis]|nr:hypothetical protein FQR65_LT16225 [Abscondita terminalis]